MIDPEGDFEGKEKVEFKSNKYDYILAICAAKEGKFSKPGFKGEAIYSTNSFLAVKIPVGLPGKIYGTNETEFETVFKKEETTDKHTITLPTGQLLGMVSDYGLYIDLRRECKACHGQGESECWHCGHESECETCSGSGKTGEEIPTHTFSFNQKSMKVDGRSFTPAYLHIVGLIAATLGDSEVKLEVRGLKAHVEFGDGVEMILMLQHG